MAENHIQQLEAAFGRPLPAPYRALLAQIGAQSSQEFVGPADPEYPDATPLFRIMGARALLEQTEPFEETQPFWRAAQTYVTHGQRGLEEEDPQLLDQLRRCVAIGETENGEPLIVDPADWSLHVLYPSDGAALQEHPSLPAWVSALKPSPF